MLRYIVFSWVHKVLSHKTNEFYINFKVSVLEFLKLTISSADLSASWWGDTEATAVLLLNSCNIQTGWLKLNTYYEHTCTRQDGNNFIHKLKLSRLTDSTSIIYTALLYLELSQRECISLIHLDDPHIERRHWFQPWPPPDGHSYESDGGGSIVSCSTY